MRTVVLAALMVVITHHIGVELQLSIQQCLHRLIGIANFIRDVDPGDAACTAHLEKLHAILWNRRQKQLSEQFRRGL